MTNQISAKLAAIIAVADDDSYDEIDKERRKIWRNADGQIHRDGDLPAVIYDHGAMYYYKDGKQHRDGGLPAVVWGSGYVKFSLFGI